MKITGSFEIDNVAEVAHLIERLDKARWGTVLLLVMVLLAIGCAVGGWWLIKHLGPLSQ